MKLLLKALGTLGFIARWLIICWVAFLVFDSTIRVVAGSTEPKIIENSLKKIPLFSSFQQQFPHARNSISYISGMEGLPHTWDSTTTLYQRYIFKMKVPVKIHRFAFLAVPNGKPTFHLLEIQSLTQLSGGARSLKFSQDIRLNEEDWKKLEANGGDFESLGIKLDKDNPVEGVSLDDHF